MFPALSASKCVADDGVELVCLTPADASLIWAWARDMGRWTERVQVCLDTEQPLRLLPDPVAPSEPSAVKVADLTNFIRQLTKDPRITITAITWQDCGYENAYYWPTTRSIVICREMLKYDTAVLHFFLAHEVAHAYIIQLDLPYTGSHEAAADELAALMLITLHLESDLLTASAYWSNKPGMEPPGWDDHPTNQQRYHRLRCMATEAMTGTPGVLCSPELGRQIRSWNRLLK